MTNIFMWATRKLQIMSKHKLNKLNVPLNGSKVWNTIISWQYMHFYGFSYVQFLLKCYIFNKANII